MRQGLERARGNRNAVTHGRNTTAALAGRRMIMRLIQASLLTLEEMGGRKEGFERRRTLTRKG